MRPSDRRGCSQPRAGISTCATAIEVTLEANPGTIERGRFAGYAAAGVNRVSLGAQSFDARALQALGRIHSPGETSRAAEELHAAGLTNFNLDLMYALPGRHVARRRERRRAGARARTRASLALSAHARARHGVRRRAAGAARRRCGAPKCSQRAASVWRSRGFAQYEVSAYARRSARCRHNLNYWTFGDYLGVGAGAHGKLTLPTPGDRPHRRNCANRAAIWRRTRARSSDKPSPQADLPFEFMMNALRLVEGFDGRLFAEPHRPGLGQRPRRDRAADGRGLIELAGRALPPDPPRTAIPQRVLLDFCRKRPKRRFQRCQRPPERHARSRLAQSLYTGASGLSANERITCETGQVAE